MENDIASGFELATRPILEHLRDGERPAVVAEIEGFDARLRKFGRDFAAAVEVLNSDRDLSSEGRQRRVEAVRVELAKKVQGELAARLTEIDEGEAKWQGVLRAVGTPTDPVEALRRELRHAEIRRGLGDLDATQLRLLYEAGSTDDEFRMALRSAPPRAVRGEGGRVEVGPWVANEVVEAHLAAGTTLEAGWLRTLRKQRTGYTALAANLNRFAGIRPEPAAVNPLARPEPKVAVVA